MMAKVAYWMQAICPVCQSPNITISNQAGNVQIRCEAGHETFCSRMEGQPARTESEQLPAGYLPLLAEAHERIMAVFKDRQWNNERMEAGIADALADLIMAVLDDTMSSSGT